MFSLVNALIGCALTLPYLFLAQTDSGIFFYYLAIGYGLLATLPSWSCSVRRLHDTGRSGWWLLLYMIPLIGLILIVLLALDSEPGRNKYGPYPKSLRPTAWTI
jgi:uncharacterized membrane protein YhaH (DUF805 family)